MLGQTSKKRDDHKLTLFFKIYNNLLRTIFIYLYHKKLKQSRNILVYNLRNAQDLRNIRTRTSLFYIFLLSSTRRQWNNLFIETSQLNSLNTFKWFLKKDKSFVPKCYLFGNPQILHTRLRTGCSSLNLDLFLKYFRFANMPLW